MASRANRKAHEREKPLELHLTPRLPAIVVNTICQDHEAIYSCIHRRKAAVGKHWNAVVSGLLHSRLSEIVRIVGGNLLNTPLHEQAKAGAVG